MRRLAVPHVIAAIAQRPADLLKTKPLVVRDDRLGHGFRDLVRVPGKAIRQ